MMNIRNIGSKESVGVKFEESVCAELCLKSSSLKATGIFVILKVRMESNCPERKS